MGIPQWGRRAHKAHLGVGVRADPTSRGSALKNRGDTHAELIKRGNAYSKRGVNLGVGLQSGAHERRGLREETDRG